MHKFVWKWLFSLCLILGAALAAAQEVAPDILLSQVTSDVIAIVKQARTERTSAPRKIADLVEIRILPHFDFTRMTQSATARHWREATQQQQAALTAEFRTLLVHTYSSAIARYDDQAIEFKRLKATPTDTEVLVNSLVRAAGAEPLAIDYAMARTPAGWKVYDVRIAGVSLVAAYRESFASKIRESGVDGLIQSLTEKNRRAA